MSRRRTRKSDEAADPDFLDHIFTLGLSTAEEYVTWCANNGFSERLHKHWRERCKERFHSRQASATRRLKRRKQETRNPRDVLLAICDGNLGDQEVTQPQLKRLCLLVAGTTGSSVEPPVDRRALRQLVAQALAVRAKFFDGAPTVPTLGRAPYNTILDALARLSAYRSRWLRPLSDWKPRTYNAGRQFASLLRHLLIRHDLPRFLDTAWFTGATEHDIAHRRWYVSVGAGGSIRSCDLPFPYTKRMGHHFMRAPDDLTIRQALRWGQVRGMGGSGGLARAIAETRLAETTDHEDFWRTVLAWFVENTAVDRAQIGPIVDFLHNQRCVPEHESELPPQPRLSMKGRTPRSLLRKVDAWHGRLATKCGKGSLQWKPSGIESYAFIEGSQERENLKCWTIRELVSSRALVDEGRRLKHCVATYASSCALGKCSIWSLELETDSPRRKLLTIEVCHLRLQIVQARGKANRPATEKERSLLRRWAAQAGLNVAAHV